MYSPSWLLPEEEIGKLLEEIVRKWTLHWADKGGVPLEGELMGDLERVKSSPQTLRILRDNFLPIKTFLRKTTMSGEMRLVLRILVQALSDVGLWVPGRGLAKDREALDAYWWLMGLPQVSYPPIIPEHRDSHRQHAEQLISKFSLLAPNIDDLSTSSEPFSLVSCCDILGLRPAAIRECAVMFPKRGSL